MNILNEVNLNEAIFFVQEKTIISENFQNQKIRYTNHDQKYNATLSRLLQENKVILRRQLKYREL